MKKYNKDNTSAYSAGEESPASHNCPKISVLMPAWNAEKFIGEAIDSILSQTYKDFEFIIINDGSTDIPFLKIKSICTSKKVFLFSIIQLVKIKNSKVRLFHLIPMAKIGELK
jgi:glycosyltransferase involved in cell wall biosynthesis